MQKQRDRDWFRECQWIMLFASPEIGAYFDMGIDIQISTFELPWWFYIDSIAVRKRIYAFR